MPPINSLLLVESYSVLYMLGEGGGRKRGLRNEQENQTQFVQALSIQGAYGVPR